MVAPRLWQAVRLREVRQIATLANKRSGVTHFRATNSRTLSEGVIAIFQDQRTPCNPARLGAKSSHANRTGQIEIMVLIT